MRQMQQVQPRSFAVAWLAVMAAMVLVGAGCGGSNANLREVGQTGLPGHLEMVGEDATLVVSVNSLSDRLEAITTSRAYARLKGWLEAQGEDTELLEMASKSDAAAVLIKEVLAGRLTLALYEQPGTEGTEDEFVLIADADVQSVIQRAMALDENEVKPSFQEVEPGIFQVVDDSPEGERVYLAQVGATGFVSSRSDLLKQTLARGRSQPEGGKLLVERAGFQELTQGLRRDAHLFVYMKDWRVADSEWDAMLGQGADNSSARGIAGTVRLDDGVELELLVEFDEREIESSDLKKLLPALRGTNKALKLPELLPSGTLAYVGVELQMDKLLAWFKGQQDPLGLGIGPEQSAEFEGIVEAFLSAFQGEFGLVLTGVPQDQPASLMLGVPAPEVALIGRLADPEAETKVLKIVQGMLGLAQMANLESGGTFGPERTETHFGAQVMVLPLAMDPGVEIAYTVHKGHFFLGTRSGLMTLLKSQSEGVGQSLSKAAGHPMVQRSLAEPGNYAIYLNLKGIYAAAKQSFGPMLGLMTGGMAGPGEDNIADILLEVFQHAGASMVYREGASTVRFFLTAQDLP